MEAVPFTGFELLRHRFLRATGIDLNRYKGKQLERRLQSLLRRHNLPDYTSLALLLDRDPGFVQTFKDFLTINVTEFFRNPEKFRELRDRYLPELLRDRPQLGIWSAGCSIGAEIYSVAMLLEELTPGRAHRLLATDIDRASLERAQKAVYHEQEIRAVPPHLRARWFRRTEDGWQLDRRITERVRFATHNMLEDPMPGDMDLILCRNVVIYFTDEAKDRLYRRFYDSLRPGGYLFTGGTETIFAARDIGFHLQTPCFYKKGKDAVRKLSTSL